MMGLRLKQQLLFAAACLAAMFHSAAQAVVIDYSVESIAGSDWRYNYTVTNDDLLDDIVEFTIYFDRSLYSNLALDTSPADWDSIVAQPDEGIPADGFFDSLALVQGITPGDSLGGFSMTFTYLGSGTPGVQPFEIFDFDLNVIAAGRTTSDSMSVPEPQTHLLMLAGLGLVPLLARRRRDTRI